RKRPWIAGSSPAMTRLGSVAAVMPAKPGIQYASELQSTGERRFLNRRVKPQDRSGDDEARVCGGCHARESGHPVRLGIAFNRGRWFLDRPVKPGDDNGSESAKSLAGSSRNPHLPI